MKKIIISILFISILLLTFSIINATDEEEIEDERIEEFAKSIAEKKQINSKNIKNIHKLNASILLEKIKIKNNNLDIYEAIYTDKLNQDKSLFILTYASGQLIRINELLMTNQKQSLYFGIEEINNESKFFKSASGVQTSLNTGYTMMRDGSITGISTNIEIIEGEGEIEIIIYKNGEPVGLRNSIYASSGFKKDFDTQSKGTSNFKAGDTISVYLKSQGNIKWKDPITTVEITED